jgi:hypothetical protein
MAGGLEDLEAVQTAVTSPANESQPKAPSASTRAARRPLPGHLPREMRTYEPEQTACLECGGGTLRRLVRTYRSFWEFVPARFQVIRIVRLKLSCAGCEHIVQAPVMSENSIALKRRGPWRRV